MRTGRDLRDDAGISESDLSGILAVFLYNFYASSAGCGNSLVPLIFLGISAVLNIILDLVFVLVLHRGVAGAAEATVISQFVSGIGIGIYTLVKCLSSGWSGNI